MIKTVLESYIAQLEKAQKDRKMLKLSKVSGIYRTTLSGMLSPGTNSEFRKLLDGLIKLEKAGELCPHKRLL